MKDELRDFIQEHRNEFDEHKIDKDALWSKIEAELEEEPKKVIPLWKRHRWKIAASILIILGSTFFFGYLNSPGIEENIVYEELQEVDNYYGSLVNQQIQLIKNHPNLSPQEQEDFLALIDELDVEYKGLKEELKEGINNEKIIEAIIHNYRQKIELMEKLLQRSLPSKKEYDEQEIVL
ncbi:hypothetical protein POV27_01335 [Aureisphaera galaxeae]|uniref:hypothetical protein n=1 Tax=Aureisphaera galaxeae TaxID=1538023 RepID=UPI00234FF8A6|nr:hypothetical protein [Aureisphaera galaxeae]MDC8002681.1 hypothetical protein [Aureisphaera galaxeae]